MTTGSIFVVVMVLMLMQRTQQGVVNDTKTATNAGFEIAANRLMQTMNFSADPCDNFYDFACGIHQGLPQITTMMVTTYQVMNQLLTEINVSRIFYSRSVLPDSPRTSSAMRKVKQYFDSCLRPVAANPIRQLNLVKEAVDALGGWPSVDPNWSKDNAELQDLWTYVGKLAIEYDHTSFLTLGIVPRNSSLIMGAMSREDMHEVKYPTTEAAINATRAVLADLYKSFVVRVYGSNGYNEDVMDRDAKQVANIWMKWWKYNQENTLTSDKFVKEGNTVLPVSQLIRRWPNINWPALLIAIADEDNNALNGIFGSRINVEENAVDYIDELMSSESRRTLQNIMIFSFIDEQSNDLATMKDLKSIGKPEEERNCAAEVLVKMPMAASYLFGQKGKLARSDIHVLHGFVSTLLFSWQGMLKTTDWLSNKSRQAAYKKIETIAQAIGYPEWIFDEGKLDEYYEPLDIDADDDDFIILNKVNKWKAATEFGQIGENVDRYMFLSSAADIQGGAWYSPNFNSITIPASNLLNKEYFAHELPISVNFGKIGTLVGHELGHAFDVQGIYYDGFGRYNNDTWMDASSRAGFEKMQECLVEQFDNYCLPNNETECVNGTATAGENIADVGGLEAAYRAFKAIESLTGEQPRLPGRLSAYTHDQIFFIAYANAWCDATFTINHEDEHTPSYYRVIGPLQDNADFARVFKCKPDQYMVPDKRCNVW